MSDPKEKPKLTRISPSRAEQQRSWGGEVGCWS